MNAVIEAGKVTFQSSSLASARRKNRVEAPDRRPKRFDLVLWFSRTSNKSLLRPSSRPDRLRSIDR
jgi:hypothetical protein